MEVVFQSEPRVSLVAGGNYITLWGIPVPPEFPPTLTVQGNELARQGEFHISLVSTKRLPAIIDSENPERIEQEIIDEFHRFIKETPLSHYELTNDFYYLERDDRKSVVAMANVPGIEEFFERLTTKYNMDVPAQVMHATIYSGGAAIGLPSKEELENIGTKIELPIKVVD